MPGVKGFPLSLRKKAIIGLTGSLLAVLFVGIFFYENLSIIKTKQHVVEVADDLSNIVLEIRRYEKNYLLYLSQEDLQENQMYVQQARQIIEGIASETRGLSIDLELTKLGRELATYEEALKLLATCVRSRSPPLCGTPEDHVRESGRKLVESSHLLVTIERAKIFDVLSTLENSLLLSLAILVVMGTVLVLFVGVKIVLPLRRIEKTTLRIAQGDFTPLEVKKSGDETQRVLEAFNRMITELEKRQEQLLQAKKLSSIGILASGIAHQLNNPLNNVSTSVQILCEEYGKGDPAFIGRLLENCSQEILRARDIVKGLLEFSRQREFSLSRVPLKEVVDKALRLISSQVPSHVEIRSDVPKEIVLDLDSQRIQEVLLNLLMNAIQAMDRDPGQIRIRAMPVQGEDNGPLVEIRVEDTGKGIAPQDLGRIFDPFFSTKEVGAGTGLGLSIAYGIIQKHQGTVTVESAPGEGTRFRIRLPAPGEGGPSRTPGGAPR